MFLLHSYQNILYGLSMFIVYSCSSCFSRYLTLHALLPQASCGSEGLSGPTCPTIELHRAVLYPNQLMLDAVPLVVLWLRLVMVGSLRRMHYDILRYIRALYDKIWNAKRQNHRVKVHNLQVLPPNKKKCEPAQAFLRSNPRWIWPSPPAELLLKVCALVFEVSWVLTKQGVEFIWSVLMHRCKQNHAQTDTRNRVCV